MKATTVNIIKCLINNRHVNHFNKTFLPSSEYKCDACITVTVGQPLNYYSYLTDRPIGNLCVHIAGDESVVNVEYGNLERYMDNIHNAVSWNELFRIIYPYITGGLSDTFSHEINKHTWNAKALLLQTDINALTFDKDGLRGVLRGINYQDNEYSGLHDGNRSVVSCGETSNNPFAGLSAMLN